MSPPGFGLCLPIFAAPGPRLFRTPGWRRVEAGAVLDLGRRADELGYDSLWVADHLMIGQDDAILEGWTTLAALAGCTRRARLGLIHQATLLRHPSMAAKMGATLDQLSGGRFVWFADPGSNAREHRAYGLPWTDDRDERVAHLAEALELTLALWDAAEAIDYDGVHYQLRGAVCRPSVVQRPHPPIWIGATTPSMDALCARFAQGWNTTPIELEALRARLGALGEACAAAGRRLADLECSLETQILVAPDRDGLRRQLRAFAELAPDADYPADYRDFVDGGTQELPQAVSRTWLAGTPDEIESQIRAYVQAGISHFLLWFMDAPDADGLELFAREVAPRFR